MTGIADSLILPIAGFLIVGLLGVIGFGIKKMLMGIYTKLDHLSVEVIDMKTESQLLRASVSEIYKTTTSHYHEVNERFERINQKVDKLQMEINDIKTNITVILRNHYKHHPDDNINLK